MEKNAFFTVKVNQHALKVYLMGSMKCHSMWKALTEPESPEGQSKSHSYSQSLAVAHRECCTEGGTGGAASQMGWWVGFRGYRRGRRGRGAIWQWFGEITCLAPHPQPTWQHAYRSTNCYTNYRYQPYRHSCMTTPALAPGRNCRNPSQEIHLP